MDKTAEEILNKRGLTISTRHSIEGSYNTIDAMEEYAAPLKKRIEELEVWISIKDKKPDKHTSVLGCHEGHDWVCAVIFDGRQWYNEFDESDCPCYPTHWKEKPKPFDPSTNGKANFE